MQPDSASGLSGSTARARTSASSALNDMSADGAVAVSPGVPSCLQKRTRRRRNSTEYAFGKMKSCQSFVSVLAKTRATPPA